MDINENKQEEVVESTPTKIKAPKVGNKTVGIIIGAIIIILGLVLMGSDVGNFTTSTTFGADFYTYIDRDVVRAANNIYYLANIVKSGFGYLLIALGMTDIAYFINKK